MLVAGVLERDSPRIFGRGEIPLCGEGDVRLGDGALINIAKNEMNE